MRNKVTQKEVIFYKLYVARKQAPGEYIKVFDFMGETYVKEVGKWGFVSHECSARASELKKENPGLVESTIITGKSGARYYGYRLSANASVDLIRDKKLQAFHRQIKPKSNIIVCHDN